VSFPFSQLKSFALGKRLDQQLQQLLGSFYDIINQVTVEYSINDSVKSYNKKAAQDFERLFYI